MRSRRSVGRVVLRRLTLCSIRYINVANATGETITLIVFGRCIFRKPIDDGTRARVAELAGAVRARQTGNFDYRVSVDTEDPRVLRLSERWDRLESFIAHGKTPEVAAIGELVNPPKTESTEVRRYEVSTDVTV